MDILEEMNALGRKAGGNGMVTLSITVYAKVPEDATTPYGPPVRKEIEMFVSLAQGTSALVNADTIEEVFEKAQISVNSPDNG